MSPEMTKRGAWSLFVIENGKAQKAHRGRTMKNVRRKGGSKDNGKNGELVANTFNRKERGFGFRFALR